jgi:hypothetical protein
LRCFGVPLHAWGIDLFRALAFKFGRFIEVDQMTRNMTRCDVARIRVLTGERKLIDSSFAVKVLGKRFDIRVVEENGGCMEEGGCRVMAVVSGGEASSKASSDGGNSVVAEVVGFSESGSEADVSDSCQVLLDLENRSVASKEVIGGSCGKVGDEFGVSGSSSHFLGNLGELVVPNVNDDGDNMEGYHVLGSGGSEKVQDATGVVSQSGCGVVVEVEPIDVDNVGSTQRLRGPSGGGPDPAQLIVGEVVCVKKRAGKKKGNWAQIP